MRDPKPSFPPLLTGHELDSAIAPAEWAVGGVKKGRLSAGDLGWSASRDDLRFALVLEPETPRPRCPEILYAAMVAVGDAIGALGPPEISVRYRWPSVILVNDAEAGYADLQIAEAETAGVPDWMVFALDLRIRPRTGDAEPGRDVRRTTLWDEGCSGVGRTALLESVSRHVVSLIHSWSEDGFKPVHEQWSGRLSETDAIADRALPDNQSASLLGLDESGDAIIRHGEETDSLATMDALERLRHARGEAG